MYLAYPLEVMAVYCDGKQDLKLVRFAPNWNDGTMQCWVWRSEI
jgi:hypothetical protein